MEKDDETPKVIVEDGVEYFDFGLPSGTLWALGNPKSVSFFEALKLNIPTREQLTELAQFTRWITNVHDSAPHYRITGLNGIEHEWGYFYRREIWCADLIAEGVDDEGEVGICSFDISNRNKLTLFDKRIFAGEKATVLLTK